MAYRLSLLIITVSVSVVCRPSNILPDNKDMREGVGILLPNTAVSLPPWSTIVNRSRDILLDLAEELFSYVTRAASYFLGSTTMKALFEVTFYVLERSIALVLHALDLEAELLESGSLGIMKKVMDILKRYLSPGKTGLTWTGEVTSSVSYGMRNEFTNYIGAIVAGVAYVAAAYGLDAYVDNPYHTESMEEALEAVMSYLPPQHALWAGKVSLPFLLKLFF